MVGGGMGGVGGWVGGCVGGRGVGGSVGRWGAWGIYISVIAKRMGENVINGCENLDGWVPVGGTHVLICCSW